MISAPLPLLETLSKILNGNAVTTHRRFSLNLCNTSKRPPFWLKTKWWLCPTLSNCLTWLCATVFFFCCQGWISFWMGCILLTLQRYYEHHWQPLTKFPWKILDNVSSSGSDAEIIACSHRGATSKRTKISNLYEYFKWIFLPCPGIFGSHLIYVHYYSFPYWI